VKGLSGEAETRYRSQMERVRAAADSLSPKCFPFKVPSAATWLRRVKRHASEEEDPQSVEEIEKEASTEEDTGDSVDDQIDGEADGGGMEAEEPLESGSVEIIDEEEEVEDSEPNSASDTGDEEEEEEKESEDGVEEEEVTDPDED
jgi:hypothetical protein